MAHEVTQQDMNLIRQGSQEVYLKVELLNRSLKILDSLETVVVNDNLAVNGDSVQRRSYTCDLIMADSSFLVGRDRKFWLDKRLRIYYGIRSLRTGEITWYRIGTFVYVSVNYKFSQTEKLLSLTCADLMAEYDGTLNGQVGGYGSAGSDSEHLSLGLTIPAGEDIRASVIAILKDARIGQYLVEDIEKEVPCDLEFQTGVTYCDVFNKLCELYDGWEFFFDVDGTFIWREIPNCAEDPVILDDSFLSQTVVDESVSSSFSGIYNVTEVWGRVLELSSTDRYAQSSSYTGNVYSVTLDGYSSWSDLDNLMQIAIRIVSTNLQAPRFSVNQFTSIPMYDGDGKPLAPGMLKDGTDYVFRYRRMDEVKDKAPAALFLLGQYQCYGKYVENSDECPYSVNNLGYEILQSVDYSGLSDDAACYNQAEYLTYTSTAMMDTVSLTSLVIPWLEVNTKVRYTTRSSNETNQYIVKDFNWSTGTGTMTMTLYKFLESFSFVYNRRHKNET